MRIPLLSIPLLVALALPAGLRSQAGMPMMRTIEPELGKVGDMLVIDGENLGQDSVAALYLTDGTVDVKVPIIEQTDVSIKFRIPTAAKPGRLTLMVLTKEKPQRLIEEPVKITVEPETTGSAIPAFGNQTIRNR
jgi:IPT/TIG domain